MQSPARTGWRRLPAGTQQANKGALGNAAAKWVWNHGNQPLTSSTRTCYPRPDHPDAGRARLALIWECRGVGPTGLSLCQDRQRV